MPPLLLMAFPHSSGPSGLVKSVLQRLLPKPQQTKQAFLLERLLLHGSEASIVNGSIQLCLQLHLGRVSRTGLYFLLDTLSPAHRRSSTYLLSAH